MQKVVRKVLRAIADYDPDYYDMYADANEAFFATLYVERIRRHAAAAGIHPPARLLEAGCQAGRLVIPLAKLGFQVTGIDTSGYALRRARAHAKTARVDARLIRGDLLNVLRSRPSVSYDIVVCAEVLYLSPTYREMLQALAGAVRPGGLLCVSHRPKFYYLFEALKRYDVAAALDVLKRTEGPYGDSAYYNWQTREELRALYDALGLEWLASYPIDRVAWLSGMSPSQLTEAQRDELRALELRLPVDGESMGRYVFVVAQRPD